MDNLLGAPSNLAVARSIIGTTPAHQGDYQTLSWTAVKVTAANFVGFIGLGFGTPISITDNLMDTDFGTYFCQLTEI